MGNIFRYYVLLAKRWAWMLVVGVVICGGATYLISTFLRPIYQDSAYLIIDIGTSAHPWELDFLANLCPELARWSGPPARPELALTGKIGRDTISPL